MNLNLYNYKLFSYWRSTCSWRVRLAMALKGLDYAQEAVDLSKLVGNNTPMSVFNAEYVDCNPMAQVPLLECTSTSNTQDKFNISQSMAIIAFLEETHKDKVSVFPKNALKKARAIEIAELINSGIQPLQNLSTMRTIKTATLLKEGDDEESVDGRGFAKNAIIKGLTVLDQKVAAAIASGEGPFAAGTVSPSIADVCLIPQLYNANRFGIDISTFPSLSKVQDVCATPPPFKLAHPDSQPDAKV